MEIQILLLNIKTKFNDKRGSILIPAVNINNIIYSVFKKKSIYKSYNGTNCLHLGTKQSTLKQVFLYTFDLENLYLFQYVYFIVSFIVCCLFLVTRSRGVVL